MTDKFRGHEIELVGSGFVYSDTKEKVSETWGQRECGYCGLHNTPEGYDGCIGEVKGAINACCGHGSKEEAYVQYPSGIIYSGEHAHEILNKKVIT